MIHIRFGPALPPSTNDEPMDEEEDVEMTSPLTAKTAPKISFGQISVSCLLLSFLSG